MENPNESFTFSFTTSSGGSSIGTFAPTETVTITDNDAAITAATHLATTWNDTDAEQVKAASGQHNFYNAGNQLISVVGTASADLGCVTSKIEPAGVGFVPFASGQRSNKVWSNYDDAVLKQRIVHWLVGGLKPGPMQDAIAEAAGDFERQAAQARVIAQQYVVDGGVALLTVPPHGPAFDKTELLLLGQALAPVAAVIDGTTINIAAGFESGLNFVTLLGLGGGMPTRVSVPASRLDGVLAKIKQALVEREAQGSR